MPSPLHVGAPSSSAHKRVRVLSVADNIEGWRPSWADSGKPDIVAQAGFTAVMRPLVSVTMMPSAEAFTAASARSSLRSACVRSVTSRSMPR